MSLDKFFNQGEDKINRYKEIIKNSTEVEKREFESQLLVPNAIPQYGGPVPIADEIEKVTVRLVFPDKKSMALFDRFFKVSNYIEKSVYELNLLIALLTLLESGKISYDSKKSECFIVGQIKRRSR